MPTECSAQSLDFGAVEGRRVEAAFDAGLVTSDAGALLLGATDRAIRMMNRVALCFHDERRPEYIEHEVATLVGQRVFGIALGYEDLNDHDELRHARPSSQHRRIGRTAKSSTRKSSLPAQRFCFLNSLRNLPVFSPEIMNTPPPR